MDIQKLVREYGAIGIAIGVGAVAIIGSLIFSLYMEYPPCDLCWYQRIAMYPIPIILALGFFRKEQVTAAIYSLPLAIIGLAIALYHNTIYYAAILNKTSGTEPCGVSSASCTSRYFELFGFISIPLMSLIGFIVILVCLGLILKYQKK